MARPSQLPVHPRALVLGALRKSKVPMTAYALLEKLERHGIKGPPVVYRALNALMKEGLVHKVQSAGTYIACNCDKDHDHTLSVLTICGACDAVEELHNHDIIQHFEKLRGMHINLTPHAVLELPVTCAKCAAQD